MNEIILKNQTPDGKLLQATYLPNQGMNMISYRKGDIEVIDQSTRSLFEERFAGMGALIGPHFHHRRAQTAVKVQDESLFPHIARLKAKGVVDPFPHGIGRYAPWKTEVTENSIKASLSGKDQWNGIPLAQLEGQNFKMEFDIQLTSKGLQLELSVVSDTDSLVGLHYYYHLPTGRGKVISSVQNTYLDQGISKPIPNDWDFNSQHVLTYDLSRSADYAFHPFPNPREGQILLDAENYRLLTRYWCVSQENSWQIYHPQEASFVCIEPISAQDPRHANLTVSSIKVELEIL